MVQQAITNAVTVQTSRTILHYNAKSNPATGVVSLTVHSVAGFRLHLLSGGSLNDPILLRHELKQQLLKVIVLNLNYIRHLHIYYNAPYLLSPKFSITSVFHFPRVLQPSQEKLKTMLMQNFGGQMRCFMGDVQVAYGVTNVRQNTQSATQPFLGS